MSEQAPRGRGGRGGRGQGGEHRSGRGGGRGNHEGGGRGGHGAAPGERPKKDNILDLAKYMDKKITVKFTGGREGMLLCVGDERRCSIQGVVKRAEVQDVN